MKVFVALEVSTYIRRALVQTQSKLADMVSDRTDIKSIVEPCDFHITLRYIGPVDDIQAIDERLKTLTFSRFLLKTDSLGFFNQEQCLVVWAGISGEVDKLQDLKRAVDYALCDLPCAPAEHEFIPHITLLYLNEKTASTFWDTSIEKIEMEVKRINLYEIVCRGATEHFRVIRSFMAGEGKRHNENDSNPMHQ